MDFAWRKLRISAASLLLGALLPRISHSIATTILPLTTCLAIFWSIAAQGAPPTTRRPVASARQTNSESLDQAAPIDDEVTDLENTAPLDLDPKALHSSDLPIRWNPHTARFLRFFRENTHGQARLRSWLNRLGRYEAKVRKRLLDQGLPGDLVYILAIESSFDPRQRSFAGAAGLWQFMPTTARAHGLRVDHWLDERLDAERSTQAAAAYLGALKARFGNWELALAAYNAGFGVISATMTRHQTNNFWALCEIESGLPLATANYVPKVLAVALADRNRDLLPFAIDREAPRTGVPIAFPGQMTLREIAKAIGSSEAVLADLNPALLRKRIPPDLESYTIEIPAAQAAAAREFATKARERKNKHRTHALRLAEDIDDVAVAYQVRAGDLRELNGLRRNETPASDTLLLMPTESREQPIDQPRANWAALPPLSPTNDQTLVLLEVRPHTPLDEIAKRLQVALADLIRWNDLDPSAHLWSGQVLQALIARQNPAPHGIRTLADRALPRVLRGSKDHLDSCTRDRGLVRQAHVVRRGETLAKIAKRYRLSLGSIARINGLKRESTPEPGTVLVVYAPPRRGAEPPSGPPPQTMPTFGKGIARTTEHLLDPTF